MKFILILFIMSSLLFASDPVTPNASPEAKALLNFLTEISGKYTLTGQHNYPNIKDKNTRFAANYIGKTPVVFSIDMGHAKEGDTDSYLARPAIVEECIRQHRLGSIITICWHAVPPTAEEPITFSQLPGSDPNKLKSVQGKLLDAQFKDVLTPGTALHTQWAKQVDSVAVYLKKLEAAKVPILWRPYHEMNGEWFWWGGRHGEFSTRALYKQIFDRLVNHHKLNNLIWVWSVDRAPANQPNRFYSHYYPGNDYLDVIGLDVYGRDFAQSYYDSLVALSHGKPLALAEVGNPPSLDILEKQPLWTHWTVWAGMVRNTLKREWDVLTSDPHILSLEDEMYGDITEKFRDDCMLPSLKKKSPANKNRDLSGQWIINENKGVLGNAGIAYLPYKLKITFTQEGINIHKTTVQEFADDRVEMEIYPLDGKEMHSVFRDNPRVTTTTWSASGDTLEINTKTTINSGQQPAEIISKESWCLDNNGNELKIKQYSKSPWRGESTTIIIYEKK